MSIITDEYYPFCSVDPGKTTAVTLWTRILESSSDFQVSEFRYKKPIENYTDYIKQMVKVFSRWIVEHDSEKRPKVMVIEGAGLWNSLTSRTSASRGDSFGLAMLVGAFVTVCIEFGIKAIIVSPQEWKGQLSKQATAQRVRLILKKDFPNEHIIDSVAIGLWAQGKFTVKGVEACRINRT